MEVKNASVALRKSKGGRDVAKSILALLVVLSSALAGAQQMERLSGESKLDRSAAFGGSPVACSQPQVLQVPQSIAQRAKLKLRLINLLRESLYDDAKGIVNIAREKEIRKLASKLRNGEP
jgi:hypothetical protein